MSRLLPWIFWVLLAVGAPLHGAEEEPYELLRRLYDRADLVVEVTAVEAWEGGIGSGRVDGSFRILSILPRVRVEKVFKGKVAKGVPPFLVEMKVPFADSDGHVAWVKKGERMILFLEDRILREPTSHLASGDEVVRYRMFELWFGRQPANGALRTLLEEWSRSPVLPEGGVVGEAVR